MLSRIQELALIARCIAADDRDAFGQLVTAYADDIRRLLLSLTRGNVALVDDLAQEAFLKAYLSIRSFRGVARFRTWIYRIAYNEYIDYTRHQRPESPLAEDADFVDSDSFTSSGLSVGEAQLELDEALRRAVASLPEGERVVTQLFYFDEFPIKRISDVTGMPSGTVKSYLSRARHRLECLLETYRSEL